MVLLDRRNLLLVCRSILFVALASLICTSARCTTHGAASVAAIPSEVRSSHFLVTINGHRTPVMHAAAGYYLLNFDLSGPAEISVTAADAHFWDGGVELQPLRLGIRPTRRGPTIRFRLNGPTKLTIARPGDHFADAEMLFLFANEPDPSNITPQMPGIRYYAAGVHHESINAQNGDRIYLADGAVLFGSLNIWQVHDVHVFGHGTIIYDGTRLPASYANFYIANGGILVPTFDCPQDPIAAATLARLFPGRRVVAVPSTDLVWGLGSVHCLSQQHPLPPKS